ncbi:Serine/threonine-protein kinase pim-3, partial [Acanthisitta chloris]
PIEMPEYSPPEQILFHSCCGHLAIIWSLGSLLCDMACGDLPFNADEDIVQGQLSFPPRVSQGGVPECLSIHSLDRLSLEDFFKHSWL